jgi:hypothetical protein
LIDVESIGADEVLRSQMEVSNMNGKGWLIIVGVVVAAAAAAIAVTAKKKPTQQTPKVREAAVGGLFYPSKNDSLAAMVDELLSKVDQPPIKNLRGLVCPHAGYEFSGQTAAHGFKQLQGREFETVVILAPSHTAAFQGAAVSDAEAFQTPLGPVEVSPKARKLGQIRPFVVNPRCRVGRPSWWSVSPKKAPPPGQDDPHTWEHSVEVQLPFLQRTLKDFKIVPVVFGQVDPEEVARVLVQHIDDKTLIVASSDLSHYYPYEVARRMDEACVKAICDLDINATEKQEACGKAPILTLMHIARKKNWKARLLDYRNSGDTAGGKSGVVGYAAIAFFEAEKAEGESK